MKKLLLVGSLFCGMVFSWAIETSQPSDYIHVDYIAEQCPSINKKQLLVDAQKHKKTASECSLFSLKEFVRSMRSVPDVVVVEGCNGTPSFSYGYSSISLALFMVGGGAVGFVLGRWSK